MVCRLFSLLFGNSLNVVRYLSQEQLVQRQQKRTIFLLLAKQAAAEKKPVGKPFQYVLKHTDWMWSGREYEATYEETRKNKTSDDKSWACLFH